MGKRDWELFIRGETNKVDNSPLPTKRLFSLIRNCFLKKDGTLHTRGGLPRTSPPIAKIPNYYASYIYQQDSRRISVFQFGELVSGSQLARNVYYSIIDTVSETVSTENALLGGTGFYFEHFQIVSRRTSKGDDRKLKHFATGASTLKKLVFSNVQITVERVDNASHPYAPTVFNNFLVALFNGGTLNPQEFDDNKAFGTVLLFYDVRDDVSSGERRHEFELAFNVNELAYQLAFFAESLFILTSQGLRQSVISPEFSPSSQVGFNQTLVARFPGNNVPFQMLHGNFLYYSADEIRVRDVSSLQAGLFQAGDFAASPNAEDFVAVNSAYFYFEDIAFYVTQDKTKLKALTGFITNEEILHPVTTFLDVGELGYFIEGISSQSFTEKNLFLLIDTGTQLEVTVHDKESSLDWTGEYVTPQFETSYFAQLNSIDRMELHIQLNGAEFVFLPSNRIFYEDREKDVAIVAQEIPAGSMRYGGNFKVSFATTTPVIIKFYMTLTSEVVE